MDILKNYITKPENVRAAQVTWSNIKELAKEVGGRYYEEANPADPTDLYIRLEIPTFQGILKIERGDWVVKDNDKGVWYGMTNDEFNKKFREVGKRQDLSDHVRGMRI